MERPGAVNVGRRSPAKVARGTVSTALRAARDKLAAASMRIQGSADERVPAEGLLEAWLAVATADFLPAAPALAALERQTLAGWGDLSLGDKLKLLEAWGATQQRHPQLFSLARPLLRAARDSMWREGGTASAAEISAAAVRVAPFLKTPSADLARSLLDAAVHWAAQRVRAEGPTAAPAFAAVLALAPQVSRTERPQRQLHLLRQAASQAKTDEQRLEEAIEQRVEWLKGTLRCDSVAARGRVVASLARTSMEAGGDIQAIRATLIQARRLGAGGTAAFGHPPEEAGEAGEEGAEGEGGGLNKQLSDTQKALLEWQRTASDKLRMQAAAQAAVAEVAAETQGTADGGAARDPAAPASAGGHRLVNVRSDGSVRAATP